MQISGEEFLEVVALIISWLASLFPKAKGNRLAVKNINAGNLFWFVNSDSGGVFQGKTVHHQTRMGVHDAPESVFMIDQNMYSADV
jgi:hypothetical protein